MLNRHQHQLFRFLNAQYFGTIGQLYYGTTPMIYVTVFLLIVCFGSVALADGFKTIDGKEYKNVTVSRVEPDGIVLSSKSGISKVYFTELPKEVQERFHYDAAKAAESTSDQNEKIKALQLQRAEEAQKRAEERERYWSEHGATSPQSSSLTSVPNQQADHSGGAVRNQPASSTTLSGVRVGPGSVPMLTLQRFESDQFSMVGKVIGVQLIFGTPTRTESTPIGFQETFAGTIHSQQRTVSLREPRF
jgi:hypothetical protein